MHRALSVTAVPPSLWLGSEECGGRFGGGQGSSQSAVYLPPVCAPNPGRERETKGKQGETKGKQGGITSVPLFEDMTTYSDRSGLNVFVACRLIEPCNL